MNKQSFIILILTIWVSSSSFTVKDGIRLYQPYEKTAFDTIPYMVDDKYFIQAYDEITQMLESKDSSSLKRAEFLVEWAYFGGKTDYKVFSHRIDSVVTMLKGFIKVNNLDRYKTAGNFALFEYFTKPNPLNDNKSFKYDFEDFIGEKDFRKLLVSKVMETHTGQCTSLPMYYKILSDELGAKSHLAFAPMHMYVKHLSEDNRWVNIELTNGHFATDAWMISSMDITAEAIKNKIYLDAIDDKQTMAYMLCRLSQAYQRKYGYDNFALLCANETLKYFPHCLSALFILYNTYREYGLNYIQKFGQIRSSFSDNNYWQYKAVDKLIQDLGYRDMSLENYEDWQRSMDEEIEKQKKMIIKK